MALYIRNADVDRLAHELAEATGETLTEAVGKALTERLHRIRPIEPRPTDRLRRDLAMKMIREAREMCQRAGVTAPTKEEIEELLGMEY